MSTQSNRCRPHLLRTFALASTMLCATIAAPSFAQTVPVAPTRELLDANSVDLLRGTYVIDETVASIGGNQGMQYRRIHRGQAGFTDNFTALLQSSGTAFLATVNGRTDRFTKLGTSTFTSTEANGSSLTFNATSKLYTYVARDGTMVTFDKNKVNEDEPSNEGPAVSIVQPNGERVDFAFERTAYCLEYGGGGDLCTGGIGHARRLSSARNANGYIFKTTYAVDTIDSPSDVLAWKQPVDQRLVNRAVDHCDPSGACNLVQNWPGPGNPNHLVNNYVFAGDKVTGVRRPGSASNDLTLAYDANGRVTSVADHSGTTGYAYADAGNIRTVTVTNALSEVTLYEFDIALERLTKLTDPLGNSMRYEYDPNGRLTKIIKPEGNHTQYAYDARGNLTESRQVAKAGSGAPDIVTSASFSASCASPVTCNSPTSTTDARGNVTNYSWDSGHGGLLTLTAPAPVAGAVRPQKRFAYASKQAQIKNASGAIVGDGQSVVLPVSVSECVSAASCAGSVGEIKSSVDYGAAGVASNLLPVSVSVGDGSGALTATTRFAYDNIGNLTSVDGPLAGAEDTSFAIYDALRRNIGTITPDPDGGGSRPRLAQRQTLAANGDVTKTEVGTVNGTGAGDLASMTPAQAVEYAYDADGRKVKEALTSGGIAYSVTQASYDAEGRLMCTAQRMNTAIFSSLPASACTPGTAGSAGADRITKSIRDASGRVFQVKQAVGTADEANERTLGFSANGQIAFLTDGENNRTTYDYDGHDRRVKTRYPVTAAGQDSSSTTDFEQLVLDAGGNVTSRMVRGGQIIGYSYNALGRLTAKDLPGAEPDATYSYDLVGRITGASQNGITSSMSWDVLGRRLTEVSPEGTVTNAYDLAGRRTQVTLPGSTSLAANYDYDVLGNVTFIRENGAVSNVGVLATYQYDSLSRRSSVTFGNGVSQAFTYDPVARLASHTNDLANSANDLTQTFGYNPASQIASVSRSSDLYVWTGRTNESLSSNVNGLNQIGNIGPKAVTHDSKGNITGVGTDSYGYTSENFLVSGPGSAALSYDPMGRLSQVTQGAATTRFGYDGLDRIAEYDGSNVVQRRYIHGPGVDNPISWYEGSGTTMRRFLSTDERGSVVALTDNTGGILSLNKYDEFGVPQNTNVGKFGYTGQAWVPEVGLWYYKARFYRPDIGRFLQVDPIGYEAGTNLYSYVGNDPVNSNDPLGLCPPGQYFYVPPNPGGPSHVDGSGRIVVTAPRGYCRSIPGSGMGPGGWGPPRLLTPIPGANPRPPKTQTPTPCQKAFLKDQLGDRGLPTNQIDNLKFVSGLDSNANAFTRSAFNGGANAVTQGSTVYVQPSSFATVANFRSTTGFEEAYHTAQFASNGGFYSTYGLLSLGGLLAVGNSYRGNAYEAFAKGAATQMFEASKTGMC